VSDDVHTATCFLQLVPKTRRRPSYYGGDVEVVGLEVARMTKTQPDKPIAGAVTVRANITIPDAVFLPLTPTVDIDLPAQGVDATPIVDATPMPVPALDDEEGDEPC
jgi:hypothetical protein